MPFHNYTPKTARTLFKSSTASPILSSQSPSRITKTQAHDRKPSPLSKSLKENLERTRALLASIKKEKYDTDLELSRMGDKAVAKARLEAAQRAALNDELREEALEQLRTQETPQVIENLRSTLEPTIREELLQQLRAELRPKVHAELRTELVEELTEQVKSELKEDQDLKDDAIEELKAEMREDLEPVMRELLYPEVVAELKEEYKVMVIEQLKGELAAEAAAQVNGINGHHNIDENSLDPALREASEASDIVNAPSELAVIAKRRFSDTFQGEDPETRKKKLKLVNSNTDRPAKADSLPPFGTFAIYNDIDVKPVDESLEEGETADVEDETNNHGARAIGGEAQNERLEEVDQVIIPEDVYADGGDEMSQPSDEEKEAHSDEDANAEPEDFVMTHHEQPPKLAASDAQAQGRKPTRISARNDKKPTKGASTLPKPTRVLRSSGRLTEANSLEETNQQQTEEVELEAEAADEGEEEENHANNIPPRMQSGVRNHLVKASTTPAQDSSALSEPEGDGEDLGDRDEDGSHDPHVPRYMDNEGPEHYEEEGGDTEASSSDGEQYNQLPWQGFVHPFHGGHESSPSAGMDEGEGEDSEDEEEQHHDGEDEDEDDDEDGHSEEDEEEEEADEEHYEDEDDTQPLTTSIYSQAGANQDEPIELDSD